VSPHAHRCQEVRDRLAAFAAENAIPHDDFTAFMTAVGEAVANAVEHSGAESPIEVECRAAGDRIVATVRDAGVGFHLKSLSEGRLDLPRADAERGRGIVIMRRCSDIFAIESRPGSGTSVTVGRVLRSGSRSPGTWRPSGRAAPA
jgi:anti-sigma regulatory factor (Ser/Thr protein kinase)